MKKEEKYHGCILSGNEEAKTREGKGYWVVVYPEKTTSEDDRLFTEYTFISGTAIAMKYGSRSNTDVVDYLKNITFSKARARLALGLYDNGKEYRQEIFSNTLKTELKAVEDEYVQQWILNGLLNIRKKNPINYKFEFIDVDGFCQILAIEKEQFLFNTSILLENGLVQEGPTNQLSIRNGGIHITSSGVTYLSSYKKEPKVLESIEEKVLDIGKIEQEYQYDVAISYAGENRQVAEELATSLKKRNIRVFYDNFEQAELWGKNLYEHLSYVYNKAALFCIILISKHYSQKSWTNLERRSAQARAFREKQEYILPIRIDDTELPGLPETVGYVSLNNFTIEKIVDLVVRKLNKL